MQISIMWLRQMAQVSITMSHDQNATALHFFTSNRSLDGRVSSVVVSMVEGASSHRFALSRLGSKEHEVM